jgi:SPP1 gp7 family putative phage head morphogenesis protein
MFTFTPLPHTEAVSRIEELPVVTREVMRGLVPELQAHAFTVAGLQGAEQMARVKKILGTVPAGANWTDAKKQVVAELTAGGLDPKTVQRRAETLLRTTAFRAYAATRYRVLMAQRDIFPFWQYKTAGDGNVRPAHTALHNQVFPAGHDIWQRIFPPWGWGCRCLVVPLTKRAAERMGAASEERRAKGEESLPAEGGLLKGQRQAPVIYTPNEADLIARSARLPGGISLEVDPTWGRSPWSEKGNLRPSWDYLESLYKDDPEAFAAFRDWSEKTEIRKGVTVSAWIGGDDALAKVSTKAPTKASKTKEIKPVKASVATVASALQAELRAAGATEAVVNFKGADLAVAQQMSESLADHLRDFPRLAERLDFFGTSTAQGAYVRERFLEEAQKYADGYWSNSGWPQADIDRQKRAMIDKYLRRKISRMPKASAFYHRKGKGKDILVMNKKGANPINVEVAAMERSVDSGWWPKTIKGTPPGKFITTHELGHAMDALLDLRRQPEIIQIWRTQVQKLTRAQAADQLSIYGASELAEMIAEAWTEYRHAPKPRQLALEIGSIIQQKYLAAFPS